MKAIIIGATGATGRELVHNLLHRDWISEVVALVKSPKLDPHPKLQQIVVNFDKLEEHSTSISGDVAFSCLGTTLKVAGSKEAQFKVDYGYQYKFAALAKKNGIKTFVLLSSLGAKPTSMLFYSKMKGQLEEAVKGLKFNKLIIVKPSLLIRGASSRKNEEIGIKVVNFFNKMGLMEKQRPLPVSEVANAMVESLDCSTNNYKEINVDEIIRLNNL